MHRSAGSRFVGKVVLNFEMDCRDRQWSPSTYVSASEFCLCSSRFVHSEEISLLKKYRDEGWDLQGSRSKWGVMTSKCTEGVRIVGNVLRHRHVAMRLEYTQSLPLNLKKSVEASSPRNINKILCITHVARVRNT